MAKNGKFFAHTIHILHRSHVIYGEKSLVEAHKYKTNFKAERLICVSSGSEQADYTFRWNRPYTLTNVYHKFHKKEGCFFCEIKKRNKSQLS